LGASRASVDGNNVSVLAVLETAVAVAISWSIAFKFGAAHLTIDRKREASAASFALRSRGRGVDMIGTTLFETVRRTVNGLLNALGLPRNALLALLVLALGIAAALLVDRVARRLIGKATALLATRGHVAAAAPDSERVETAVGRTLYWIVVLLAVMAATELLGLPVVTAWLSGVASYLPRVAVAVVIAALGTIAGRTARHMVTTAATSARLPAAQRLGRLAQIAILIGTALVAIEQLGIAISFLKTVLLVVLAALLAGGALAFGLGGQHVVANILSAYYVQKLYQVGQIIRLTGLEGRIARITDTTVIIESADGQVAVPAREIAESRSTLVLPVRGTR
jgi:hypothetical protein